VVNSEIQKIATTRAQTRNTLPWHRMQATNHITLYKLENFELEHARFEHPEMNYPMHEVNGTVAAERNKSRLKQEGGDEIQLKRATPIKAMRCDIMKMRSNADEHTDSNAKNKKKRSALQKARPNGKEYSHKYAR